MELAEIFLSMIEGKYDTKTAAAKLYEAYTGRKPDEEMLDEIVKEVEGGDPDGGQ